MYMRGMNQKILGAFVLGVGLIAGAYTYVNFGNPRSTYPVNNQEAAPIRSAIAVTDSDNNGIEDWRDVFTTAEPVVIGEPSASYTPPTTMTGRLGISLFEDYIRSKNYGPFGRTQEEVVVDKVNELARDTEQTLFGLSDISIIENWNEGDMKNFANASGNILLTNNKKGLDDELTILNDILSNGNTSRVNELVIIAETYKNMRDDALLTPVPVTLAKEHLDLINTYEAIYQDVTAMALGVEDPVVALVRIKRYQDDALGLSLALQNMYNALEPYANLFATNDPALVFANFNSQNVAQQ